MKIDDPTKAAFTTKLAYLVKYHPPETPVGAALAALSADLERGKLRAQTSEQVRAVCDAVNGGATVQVMRALLAAMES